MGINVRHNGDGSVTVSCGKESATVFPQLAAAKPGKGGGVTPVVIHTSSSDDDDDPLVGWPLPGALVKRLRLSPLGNLPVVHAYIDPATRCLGFGKEAQDKLRAYAYSTPTGEVLPFVIQTEVGQSFSLETLRKQLRDMRSDSGHQFLPYLTTGNDDR